VLGDLKVKVKDIIQEGIGTKIADMGKNALYATGRAAGIAAKQTALAPFSYAKELLTPKALKDVLDTPTYGKTDGRLSNAELDKKSREMFGQNAADWGDNTSGEEDKGVIADPSTSSPLHPEVKVFQSYPLVLQVKNKRYEMDEFGEFHPFGTNGKVTPAVQAFLSKERDKL